MRELIGTRNGEQIRSHAQKYLNKLKYEEIQKNMAHLEQEERVVFHVFKAKKRVNKYTKKAEKMRLKLEKEMAKKLKKEGKASQPIA